MITAILRMNRKSQTSYHHKNTTSKLYLLNVDELYLLVSRWSQVDSDCEFRDGISRKIGVFVPRTRRRRDSGCAKEENKREATISRCRRNGLAVVLVWGDMWLVECGNSVPQIWRNSASHRPDNDKRGVVDCIGDLRRGVCGKFINRIGRTSLESFGEGFKFW